MYSHFRRQQAAVLRLLNSMLTSLLLNVFLPKSVFIVLSYFGFILSVEASAFSEMFFIFNF